MFLYALVIFAKIQATVLWTRFEYMQRKVTLRSFQEVYYQNNSTKQDVFIQTFKF